VCCGFSDHDQFSFRSCDRRSDPATYYRGYCLAGVGGHWWVSLFFQSRPPGKSILSQVPFSNVDRLAVSGLRVDARFSSIAAPAPAGCVQVESADDADAAVHRLRFVGIHQKRAHREAAEASFYSAALPVAMARAANLLLDLSQHALVSIRVLNSSPLTKCQKPDRQGGPLMHLLSYGGTGYH
jgi:hypothetical protein